MAYETFRRGIFFALDFRSHFENNTFNHRNKFLYNPEGRIMKRVQRKEGRAVAKRRSKRCTSQNGSDRY